MSRCLGKIHCKTLEFELEIDFDSLWQGYCTLHHFYFNTYSQGAPQIVKTPVVVKLRHTLRQSTCVSMSFGIIEPHKILGVLAPCWHPCEHQGPVVRLAVPGGVLGVPHPVLHDLDDDVVQVPRSVRVASDEGGNVRGHLPPGSP